MTKEIQLTKGQVALVDDWNYEELNQYKWQATFKRQSASYYAVRTIKADGKEITLLMHAYIAKTPKGMVTDHIDHNTLDNRERNLRVCTTSQNAMNMKLRSDNVSGFKGIRKSGNRWMARIKLDGISYYLGTYVTIEDAISARNEAEIRLYGQYAESKV